MHVNKTNILLWTINMKYDMKYEIWISKLRLLSDRKLQINTFPLNVGMYEKASCFLTCRLTSVRWAPCAAWWRHSSSLRRDLSTCGWRQPSSTQLSAPPLSLPTCGLWAATSLSPAGMHLTPSSGTSLRTMEMLRYHPPSWLPTYF